MNFMPEGQRLELADDWFGSDQTAVDMVIRNAVIASSAAGFVNYADSVPVETDQFNDMCIVLPEIEPAALVETFGPESLVWAAANARRIRTEQRLYAYVSQSMGIRSDDAKRSVSWLQQPFGKARATPILFQMDLVRQIDRIDPTNVPELVQHFGIDGITISTARADQYGLTTLRPRFSHTTGYIDHPWDGHNAAYNIFLDGPIGLGLTYKDRPIAVAGFGAFTDKEVGIIQLQGVTGKKQGGEKLSPRGLVPLDWRGLFISIATAAARRTNASAVRINSAKQNKWLRPSQKQSYASSLTASAAERSYDIPARNHGFEICATGYWRKAI